MPVRVGKAKLWKAIRKHCCDCMGGIFTRDNDCTGKDCNLYPYRFGKPDFLSDYEEGQSISAPGSTISPPKPHWTTKRRKNAPPKVARGE